MSKRQSRQRSAVDIWREYAAHNAAEELEQQLHQTTQTYLAATNASSRNPTKLRARLLNDIGELTTALKVELVRLGVEDGYSYTKLGLWLGISPTSVMSWANRLRSEGYLDD